MVGGIVAGVIGLVIVPLLGFLLYRCFITRHRRLLQKAERELTPRPFIMQAPPPPRHRNTNRKMVDRVSATFSHLSHISGLRALTGAPATSEMPLSNSPSGPSTGYSNLATQATTTVDDEFSPTATVFTRTGSTRGPRQRSRSRSRTRGYGKTRQRPSLTTVPLIPPPLPSPSATHWPEYQLPMPSRAL
ncbi:hypothetical protein BDW22DRAFT_977313 [Trametopsis cervina]|nr:hypothetical protein BDW22DRAFT_977313 [Trametopsis cervina]